LKILGISCFYHDSAAALIVDGQVIAAALEERFTRVKHDSGFPINAIRFCLEFQKIEIQEVDAIVFYEKPFQKFTRIVEGFIENWPHDWRIFSKVINDWLARKINFTSILKRELNYTGNIYYSSHHLSHAASSYYLSPFDDCAFIVMDGVGEKASVSYGTCIGTSIITHEEINFPNSLGVLYSVFTAYLGFEVNEGEYKVMGLAPYGQPVFKEIIYKHFVKLLDDGLFELNLDYFNFSSLENNYRLRPFVEALGFYPRSKKTDPILQNHKDLARSIQEVYEELALRILKYVRNKIQKEKLVLSGGTALNCVANTKFQKSKIFKDIFIFNSPGDSGAAIGAALWLYYDIYQNQFTPREIIHNFWGPEFSEDEIRKSLHDKKISYRSLDLDDIVSALCAQKVIGWFQGRMEFGPRALGNRSILADATKVENWHRVNLKIKFRESFRPFAPVVLEEFSHEYFSLDRPSPFMMYVAQVKGAILPATTHVDSTARVQTVNISSNEKLTKLLRRYYEKCGVAALINTSLNLNNDPIACSPDDAINVFQNSEMDILVLENFVIEKKK
jgi:carbamoyltransferase